jgi:NADH-quinone oxidoreductase subunit M
MKYLPPAMLFFVAASLGLPGLGNFVGEFLILLGSFTEFPLLTVLATTGLILAAVYSLAMLQRGFFGPTKSDTPLEDLTGREIALVTSLMAVLLFMGLYPQPILDATDTVMNQVITIYVSGPPKIAPAVMP